ncbi:Putative HMP/thiamine permease protein YkoC [Acaryochloris thomasi RCC1774]|uniref:HMP/thiamine permease protein YkoC n=1 Tax=Acaryochloris thomasi RCC1774 TaxID=1764569 RepID=A0A2W1K123_9CYAN|nr:energy-coupling factor transporter transmembrane component T [Acaryochloris thomasi]PZD74251.1 Putative HMP/thiamine permease protein YkoC [Acaryochloris thomasi RCC1774]
MAVTRLQTVTRESAFTRLDFRAKLVIVALITVIAFLWESPIAGGLLTLAVIVSSLLVGVKRSYLTTLLKVMIPLYFFLLLSMGFFNVAQVKALTNKEVLTPLLTLPVNWLWVGGAQLSVEGTLYGLNIVFKTLTMILVIPLAMLTTDINNMIVALVQTKVPYKIVFVFSSTLRFFPLLFEELQSIVEAQRLRGLALEQMNPLQKVQVYGGVAVPLILGAMMKSQKLEVVLQSKAFSGSADRTYLHESVLGKADWVAISSFVGVFAIALLLYISLGVGKFAWLIYS